MLATVPTQYDLARLINTLLRPERGHHESWRAQATIEQCDRGGFEVKCAGSFLRWSKGPVQGYFWDLYGDRFDCREWALLALYHAGPPPRMFAPKEDPSC